MHIRHFFGIRDMVICTDLPPFSLPLSLLHSHNHHLVLCHSTRMFLTHVSLPKTSGGGLCRSLDDMQCSLLSALEYTGLCSRNVCK